MTSMWYLTRRFLGATATALAALFALALLLELADKATELSPPPGTEGGVLLAYMSAAAPAILGGVFPIAVLVGSMAAFARMARANEIVSLQSAGFGLHNLALRLLPAALLVGAAYFLVQFLLAPPAEVEAAAILRANTPQEQETSAETAPDRSWIRSGDRFLAFEDASPDGTVITGVTLYERGPDQSLLQRISVPEAVYVTPWWSLGDARIVRFMQGYGWMAYQGHMSLENGPVPENIRRLVSGVTATGIEPAASREWGGSLSAAYLETRRQQAFGAPLTVVIMIMASAAMARGTTRHPETGRSLGLALGLGFGYLLASGIVGAFGHTGLLPPVAAAWIPPVVFLWLTGRVMFHRFG